MQRILIIGGGIIGATIAHELSLIPGFQITLFDPGLANGLADGSGVGLPGNSTQAALGVLMGVISQKTKGLAWRRRLYSLDRYDRLVESLEAELGEALPYNREGLVMACMDGSAWPRWQQLQSVRLAQGLPLELLEGAEVWERYPQFAVGPIDGPIDGAGAIYGVIVSPRDRQLDGARMVEALLAVAKGRGVEVVAEMVRSVRGGDARVGTLAGDSVGVMTDRGEYGADWVVVAAGLGSEELLRDPAVRLRPVLGQGVEVRLDRPLGVGREPVLTGEDIHVVPIGSPDSTYRYWVGATLELPDAEGRVAVADADRLAQMWGRAVSLWPGLGAGVRVREWSGVRPRPEGRPAPVMGRSGRVVVATGHYRNGILLAPVTAREVIELMGLELPIELRWGA